MKKILKYTFYQIVTKLKSFSLEVLVMLMAFVVLLYSLVNNYSVKLLEKTTKEIMSQDAEQVYNLNLDLYLQNFTSNDMQNNIISFLDDIGSMEEVMYSGVFWLEEMQEVQDYDCFFVSQNLLGLCIDVPWSEGDGLCPVLVGSKLGDEFPVGTVFYDKFHDIDCKVVGKLEENSRWFGDEHSDLLYINIDECMVYSADFFVKNNPYTIINGLNDAYVVIKSGYDEEKVIQEINSIALANNVILNHVVQMEEAFDIEEMHRRDVRDELVIMPILLFVIAVSVILLTSIISIRKNKSNIGIMLSNGMTRADIAGIYFAENLIKINLAFWPAYIYWSNKIDDIFHFMGNALDELTLIMVFAMVVLVAVVSLLPVMLLRRETPIEMVGRTHF